MTHDKKIVDALLATASSRLLAAAGLLNQLRELHRQDRMLEFALTSRPLGEDLQVGGHAITEIYRLLYEARSLTTTKGDWLN